MPAVHAAATGLLTLLLVTSRQFGIPEAPDADHATPQEWPEMLFKNIGVPSGLGRFARLRGGRPAGDRESVAAGENEKQPEEKLEKLKPFTPGKVSMAIGGQVEKTLKSGNVFQVQKLIGRAAFGKAVMDVKASPRVVWGQILGFGSYHKKVPKVSKCEVYERRAEGGRGKIERIKAKFVTPVVPGIKLVYHVDHRYEPSKDSITWTLDDKKKNDFEDIQGHWHVEPHPKDPAMSRVFYEIGTVLPGWIPRGVMKKISGKAMSDATGWVKRESEQAQANLVAEDAAAAGAAAAAATMLAPAR